MMKKILLSLALLTAAVGYGQVPVVGTTVNATTGFRYQGGAANGWVLCGNGTNFVPAATCGSALTLYYQAIQQNGSALTQRYWLDFSPSFFTATDDFSNNRTTIGLNSSLPVDISGNASTATNAGYATNAGNASTATNAGYATNAGNASTANALAATPTQCAGGTVATGVAANGNANCVSSSTAIDYWWNQSGCSNTVGQPTRCTFVASLPANMPDSSYYVQCTANAGLTEPADFVLAPHHGTLPTTAGGSIPYAQVQVMQNGTGGGFTPTITCHAHHD